MKADFAAEQLETITAALDICPIIPLDAAQDIMEQLFQIAEERGDERGRKLVVNSWAATLAIGDQNERAMSLAEAARDIAQTMMDQRDMALEQHEELKTALEEYDATNPAVRDLIELSEEMVMEQVEAEGYFTWCPGADITGDGRIPVSRDVAEMFYARITGRYKSGVPKDIRKEIADFMADIVRRVNGE